MIIEAFFIAGTTAGSQACSILMDQLNGKSRPTLLIGRIAHQSTAGRANPPDPISDFPCGDPYSPFGKGHIMALSLGGPDVRENIVPQYEQWQANGRWRAMEVATGSAPVGDFFVVKLTYADASNALPALTARFATGEIFDWAEYRIPTRFDVWVVGKASPVGQKIAARVLGGLTTGNRSAGALEVQADLAGVAASHWFDHSVMPDEDRHHWQDLVCIVPAVADALATYNDDRQAEIDGYRAELDTAGIGGGRARGTMADVLRTPVHTPTTFVLEQSAVIRDLIWDQYGSMGTVVPNFPVRADVDNLTTDRLLRAHRFAKQSNSLPRLKTTEVEKRRGASMQRANERRKLMKTSKPYDAFVKSKGKDT